jgi:hypothetical protein
MSKKRGWRGSVRLLDNKGEPAKTPADAVSAKIESRHLTAEEQRKWEADIAANMERCRRAFEKARSNEERAFWIVSALNFCFGLPLPYWLHSAVLTIMHTQIKMRKDALFLLNERLMIRDRAAEYEAQGIRNPITQAENDIAKRAGLTVDGLRKRRSRARKALGQRGKPGRPKNRDKF